MVSKVVGPTWISAGTVTALSDDLLLVQHMSWGYFHMRVKRFSDGGVSLWIIDSDPNGWCFQGPHGGTVRRLEGWGPNTFQIANDPRPGVSAPHQIVVFNNIGGSLLFIDTEDDRDDRLSFSHIDTSDAFVLPQGTAASIQWPVA